MTKEWVKRALRTFLQSAIGYAAVALPSVSFTDTGDTLKFALLGVGVSAVAAGLAAVMNIIDERKKTS